MSSPGPSQRSAQNSGNPQIAGRSPDTPVPQVVRSLTEGPIEVVWVNLAGGITVRLSGEQPRYVKWNPLSSGESLSIESERLQWLAKQGHPAPRVLDLIQANDEEMLVTDAIDADSAVAEKWVTRPEVALQAIAEGLRRLHELPVEQCPYTWSVQHRLGIAPVTSNPAKLKEREFLAANQPPIDRLVVCHGDACAPNTLLSADGQFAATVDVGRLGVADRWADLAVAALSMKWNYAVYDEAVFWQSYGIDPQPERIAYYQKLWQFED